MNTQALEAQIGPVRPGWSRHAYVEIVGEIWWPYGAPAALTLQLSSYDIENMTDEDTGLLTRESVERWVDTHSGDFSSVTDFSVRVGDWESGFATEDGEMLFMDCTYPSEEE